MLFRSEMAEAAALVLVAGGDEAALATMQPVLDKIGARTVPPREHGGNCDIKNLSRGSKVYFPVYVDGAGLSMGDLHFSQGDGEISGTAIEASLDVSMQIFLRKDFHFPSPLLETPTGWYVHGFDSDLNVAMRNAAHEMLRLLTEQQKLSRNDAYSLMSVAADFTVTQVVDGRQGVHVHIPRTIFPPK